MFLLNGKAADSISLQDRGLMYGDGLFETIAVRNQQFEFWHKHIQRLSEGCRRLSIPPPDPDILLAEARSLVTSDEDTVIKIVITRGSGGRGYRPPQQAHPNRVLTHYDWPRHPPENAIQGIVAIYCRNTIGMNKKLAGIKHLSRLEHVMARNEWDDEAIAEGLMLNSSGHVIEGTMSNFFLVKKGRLCTPDLSKSGVAGIMRDVIFELAESSQIPLKVGHFVTADVDGADEMFFTNSLIGIWPVRQLEHKCYKLGPVAQTLMSSLESICLNHKSHEAVKSDV